MSVNHSSSSQSPVRAAEAIMHERAVETTGLDDFGSDDYHEALERLLHALSGQYGTGADFIEVAAQTTVGPLAGRLYSEEGWKQHRECLSYQLVPQSS